MWRASKDNVLNQTGDRQNYKHRIDCYGNQKKPNGNTVTQHPSWTTVKIQPGSTQSLISLFSKSTKITTICEEACCPNLPECWGRGTATFMLLGDTCTRGCRYCSVNKGKPEAPDKNEPRDLAETIQQMKAKYIVLTMVDRDDLKDAGVSHILETIHEIKKTNPNTKIELLVGDLNGDPGLIREVAVADIDVFSHNIETVKRLYPKLRPQGRYKTALKVLKTAAYSGIQTKTSLIAGMGETSSEVFELLQDIKNAGVEIFTSGQYLRPSQSQIPVIKHRSPLWFDMVEKKAQSIGMKAKCGPLVRSSYMAETLYK